MKQRHRKAGFKEVELPEPQQARARCYSVIDIGLVDASFKNEVKQAHKIMLFFEFPDLMAVFNEEKGPQPFSIMHEMTFSTNDRANFSKFVAQWRNKPLSPAEKLSFDPKVFAGKVALISFIAKLRKDVNEADVEKITNQNAYLKLNGIGPLPKMMKDNFPETINPKVVWDWDDITSADIFHQNRETWDLIPNFVRDKIKTSEEFKSLGIPSNFDESDDDSYSNNDDEDEGFGDNDSDSSDNTAVNPAQQQTHSGPADNVADEDDNWGSA